MGKNKKKEYVLDAVLDEETYMAYKSGQAIDNNGLRSPKGSYWPKQPSYREKNHIKEQLKRAGADMAVGATDYVVFYKSYYNISPTNLSFRQLFI